MLMLFLEQARGQPTWSLRETRCPRAPRWWPRPKVSCLGEHSTQGTSTPWVNKQVNYRIYL